MMRMLMARSSITSVSLTWCILLLYFIGYTYSAGVSVHLTVLERNRAFLPDDLDKHMSFARAGAFFPDAFYSCMGLSDLAEDTHWPPFMKLAVQHWKDKYAGKFNLSQEMSQAELNKQFGGRLWAYVRATKLRYAVPPLWSTNLDQLYIWDKEKELRAFLYGLLSHQVSDVSWHSLGISQGLLEYMAAREFVGDTSAAHEVLDVGGDMIFVNRLLSSGQDYTYLQEKWDYPRSDLLEIMQKAGYTVSQSQLDYCMVRGRAAVKGEIQIAQSVYGTYAEQSPILYNELESYFLGGMTEMTTSTRHCIYQLDNWFENDLPDDAWNLCEIFHGKRPKSIQHTESSRYLTFLDSRMDHPEGRTQLQTQNYQRQHNDPMLQAQNDLKEPDKLQKNPLYVTTGIPQSYFGQSISIGEFLGRQDVSLAIGAPLESMEDGSNHQKFYVPQGNVYVASLDDLTGKNPNNKLSLSTNDLQLNSWSGLQVTSKFGQATCLLKVVGKDILVVSTPGSSSISFFYREIELLRVMFPKATSMYGSKGLKLVGMDIKVADVNNDGYNEVVVSAPYTDIDNHNQRGRVFVLSGKKIATLIGVALYAANNKDKRYMLPLETNIEDALEVTIDLPDAVEDGDPQAYTLFGSKIVATKGLIIIGAVGQAKVYGFRYRESTGSFELQFYLSTHRPYRERLISTFGGALLAISSDGWLAIADSTQSSNRIHAGTVYLYRMSCDCGAQGPRPEPELHAILDFGDYKGNDFDRFGHNGMFLDNDLFIISPYAQREKGQLWRVNLDNQVPGIPPNIETIINRGPSPYANGFGTSISGIRQDNSTTLIVGMPYYKSTQGAVVIYDL